VEVYDSAGEPVCLGEVSDVELDEWMQVLRAQRRRFARVYHDVGDAPLPEVIEALEGILGAVLAEKDRRRRQSRDLV